MKALISDIHANLEAFLAVLQDIGRYRVRDIYCLGDVVGYGPNPRECVDLAMQCKVAVLGNHDEGATTRLDGFAPTAWRAIYWTRQQLAVGGRLAERRRRFLGLCPQVHTEKDFMFVHGSPRHPLREYVFPGDAGNRTKMDAIFAQVPRYCFAGHTHMPGIFTEKGQFLRPTDVPRGFRLNGQKVFCNIGAVGQSRDGDRRACYVLLDGNAVFYRRVEYDIETTRRKVREVPELNPDLWK
jgi:diadenosine tetraphosphatase ApaH/serine/threonine PP2A family protein phosphatase